MFPSSASYSNETTDNSCSCWEMNPMTPCCTSPSTYDGTTDDVGVTPAELDHHQLPQQTIHLYTVIEGVLYSNVITSICLLGILGNVLNLIAMTGLLLQKPMDRMERSATLGLLALAASDLLFCLTVLPYFFLGDLDQPHPTDRLSFMLVFATYHGALTSTLITSSTWLTVVLAVSRFLAVCHPLRARYIIGVRFAEVSIVFAFLLSVLLNLPRFWHLRINSRRLEDGRTVYEMKRGALQENSLLERTYYTSYLVLCVLLPFALLAYCNLFLIRALRRSTRMRRQFTLQSRRGRHGDTNVVTLTLTIVVIVYVVLVSPAEVSNIFAYMVQSHVTAQPAYNLAVAIANTLQTINFSLNFVLYCAINAYFRRVIGRIVTCRGRCRSPTEEDNAAGCLQNRGVRYQGVVVASGSRPMGNRPEADLEEMNRWNLTECTHECMLTIGERREGLFNDGV